MGPLPVLCPLTSHSLVHSSGFTTSSLIDSGAEDSFINLDMAIEDLSKPKFILGLYSNVLAEVTHCTAPLNPHHVT